jgi:hypothetical protein
LVEATSDLSGFENPKGLLEIRNRKNDLQKGILGIRSIENELEKAVSVIRTVQIAINLLN